MGTTTDRIWCAESTATQWYRYQLNGNSFCITHCPLFQSFDQCVEQNLSECDPNNMWLQIPFFCGHSANCWKPGNKWALAEAKKNLINNYFLVGITEELDDFVVILEELLPRMFKGAMDHYTTSNKSHLRKTVQKDRPSVETVKKIQESPVWQMENEFYEFAVEQFHFIKKHTLKNKLQNVTYEKIRPKWFGYLVYLWFYRFVDWFILISNICYAF